MRSPRWSTSTGDGDGDPYDEGGGTDPNRHVVREAAFKDPPSPRENRNTKMGVAKEQSSASALATAWSDWIQHASLCIAKWRFYAISYWNQLIQDMLKRHDVWMRRRMKQRNIMFHVSIWDKRLMLHYQQVNAEIASTCLQKNKLPKKTRRLER